MRASTSGTAVNATVAVSASLARASSSGPSRTVPGPSSEKKRATAASAMLMAAAPMTRVKASTASSPRSSAPCSKASIRATNSAGTSVSGPAGMPAASRARRTRGMETPLCSAMALTVAKGVLPCVTRLPATPGSVPMRCASTICSTVAPRSVRYSRRANRSADAGSSGS